MASHQHVTLAGVQIVVSGVPLLKKKLRLKLMIVKVV
ncbi:hypothetical protein LKI_04325 [Leuconostoc kimchii IMSNU 11154]|uniref:Uncharacterized protein n=1 Tax=Leuconostoc kimchii (strain IMSNU 11154 / KCTC 2386 / IH25) TaxID=762051 RepID=D5T2A8_LEUKI|nr:hypothetical protein LKI_04325 [Leuconostoc kimchii IMSNU 11154]